MGVSKSSKFVGGELVDLPYRNDHANRPKLVNSRVFAIYRNTTLDFSIIETFNCCDLAI